MATWAGLTGAGVAARRLSPPAVRPSRSPGQLGLDEAVEAAAALACAPVAVFDGQLRLLAHSAADEADADWCHAVVSRNARRAERGLVSAIDLRRLLAADDPIVLNVAGAHVAAGVRVGSNAIAILIVGGRAEVGVAELLHHIGDPFTRAVLGRLAGGLSQQRAQAFRRLLSGEHDGAVTDTLGLDGSHAWRVISVVTTRPAAASDEVAARRALTAAASVITPALTTVDDRIYGLIEDRDDLRPAMRTLQRRLGQDPCARVVVGVPFRDPNAATTSRESVDNLAGLPTAPVVWADDHPEILMLCAAGKALQDRADLRLPALEVLAEHDARTDSRYLETVAAWLDCNGDAPATAVALNLHPNTVRYRVRRACELAGLDLSNAAVRLAAMLELRCRRVSTECADPP